MFKRHNTFNQKDIERCIDLALKSDAVHVDNAKQAKVIVQAAKQIGLDFEYLHTPDHELYHHTVQNLSLGFKKGST